jgi:hypothetical protein
MITGAQTNCRVSGRKSPRSFWTSTTLTPCDICLFGGGVSGVMGVAQVRKGAPGNYRRAQGSTAGLQTG